MIHSDKMKIGKYTYPRNDAILCLINDIIYQ